MAFKRVVLMMAILALFVAPILGKHYFVGDKNGWRLGVDYAAWAKGKVFRVGDNLVFNYFTGAHNVVVVNGTEYTKCSSAPSSSSSVISFTSGGDVIPLTAPGERGYICTFDNHCSHGMKLLINVYSADAPLPAPLSGSSSSSSSKPSSSYVSSMIAAVALAAAVI